MTNEPEGKILIIGETGCRICGNLIIYPQYFGKSKNIPGCLGDSLG